MVVSLMGGPEISIDTSRRDLENTYLPHEEGNPLWLIKFT
jgi:hypothetical protein